MQKTTPKKEKKNKRQGQKNHTKKTSGFFALVFFSFSVFANFGLGGFGRLTDKPHTGRIAS